MPDFNELNQSPQQEDPNSDIQLSYNFGSGDMVKLPWYKSFWKVAAIIVLVFILFSGVVFGLLVLKEYQNISQGKPSVLEQANNANGNTNSAVTTIAPNADNDPYIGQANAPVEIIAFEDFQCPYCKLSSPIITQVMAAYPNDVKFVYRDFPLFTIHPQATVAAYAAECANEQDAFWEYHDYAYEHQDELTNEDVFAKWGEALGLDVEAFQLCIDSEKYKEEVQHDLDAGFIAGVNSTPTWFVNGQVYRGVLSLEQWQQIIDAELAK